MPVRDKDSTIVNYPLSRGGVALNKNPVELTPKESFGTQNCVWKNGMVKRGGTSLLTTTQVVASKKILGLHKFYKSNGTSQILAASDTLVKYFTSPSTWTSIGITQTAGLQTYMVTWGALNKVYICNGTDKMAYWNGTTAATITIADGIPRQALPYQDRLLTIIGGDLTWSASYDDTGANWLAAADCGVKPDTLLYGMCYHSVTSSSVGYETKVLLAGASGMYLFAATDLRVPSTIGDYTIYQLAISVGCNAPRTMVWTPAGTFWLATDGVVYMLPFGSVSPVPISDKITGAGAAEFSGLENAAASEVTNACACYHDGYYKLSFAEAGQTTNSTQYWLDVRRLSQDGDGFYGPWYGPMKGTAFSCFFVESGTGDIGSLLAGEGSAKGYVYQANGKGVYSDINPTTAGTQSISVEWMTFYNPIGAEPLRKDVHKMELQLLNSLGDVNVDFYDLDTKLKIGDVIKQIVFTFWNDGYWNDYYFNGSAAIRSVIDISPPVQPRRLSLVIRQNINNDAFELYAVNVQVIEQNQVFA